MILLPDMLKFPQLIACFSVLTFSIGCTKYEPCIKCNKNIESSFINAYFQVMLNSNMDSILIQTDSLKNILATYELCSENFLRNVELTKIIKANGHFNFSCEIQSNKLVSLTEFEVIEVCLPKIAQKNGTFSLQNQWMIHYIQTEDTILFPPCEGYSYINFDTQQKTIEGTISFNWFNGTYKELDTATIQMPEIFSLSLGLGTRTQTFFEHKFLDIIRPDAIIEYSIDKNFLTLSNTSKNSHLRLFLK